VSCIAWHLYHTNIVLLIEDISSTLTQKALVVPVTMTAYFAPAPMQIAVQIEMIISYF